VDFDNNVLVLFELYESRMAELIIDKEAFLRRIRKLYSFWKVNVADLRIQLPAVVWRRLGPVSKSQWLRPEPFCVHSPYHLCPFSISHFP